MLSRTKELYKNFMESNLITENTWIKTSAPVSLTLTLPTAMKEACKVERTSTPVPKDKVGTKGKFKFRAQNRSFWKENKLASLLVAASKEKVSK